MTAGPADFNPVQNGPMCLALTAGSMIGFSD
jgi:hypothetical protein